MSTEQEFIDFLDKANKPYSKKKKIELFLDIETFQYNETQGDFRPSLYKNMTFSVAVSWFDKYDTIPHWFACSNFKTFFDCVTKALEYKSLRTTVELIIHNGNKYDNHFMRKDLLHFYPFMTIENLFLKQAISNLDTVELENLSNDDKQGIILEKRVKSYNNLDMEFYLRGVHFKTIDNFMKTNISLKAIGKKLQRIGKISADELKTDFDYTKYNVSHDLEENEAYRKADEIFNSLNDSQLTYIRNDVLILAKCRLYYSEIFKGFDYAKMTFSQNVLAYYKEDNPLATFQLLNKTGTGRDVNHIKYTDFTFADENLYDYLKSFYRGGLNFYNDFLIGYTIHDVFSMDINSSYPYSMYYHDIPTLINRFDEFEKPETIDVIKDPNTYTLYRMTMKDFNLEILSQIESNIIRKMLVKYYTTNGYVNINSYTLKMVEYFTEEPITEISVSSYIVYDCIPFGAKDGIFENYKVKTQGKLDTIIDMKDPQNYIITDRPNKNKLTPEEVANAKVLLNGLYGIPALRAYFNLFRKMPNDEYENIINGYQNTERNIVFSVFVTSVSIWNLLSPLKHLTPYEIDHYFYYCDTDSLYLSEEIYHKIPQEILDPISLGKWDIEHRHLENFYILNHKKYCFEENITKTITNKKRHLTKKFKKISVRCGGVPLDTFQFYTKEENKIKRINFDDFVKHQFSQGVQLQNTKSILNSQGTISIYPSTTDLQQGKSYLSYFSEEQMEAKNKIIKKIQDDLGGDIDNDYIYFESEVGTLSQSDIFPVTNPVEKKRPMKFLKVFLDNAFKSIQKDD